MEGNLLISVLCGCTSRSHPSISPFFLSPWISLVSMPISFSSVYAYTNTHHHTTSLQHTTWSPAHRFESVYLFTTVTKNFPQNLSSKIVMQLQIFLNLQWDHILIKPPSSWKYHMSKMHLIHLPYQISQFSLAFLNSLGSITLTYSWAKLVNTGLFYNKVLNSS